LRGKTGEDTTGNGISGQDATQNLLIVWAVKKNVHIYTQDNESKIYREDVYGKPKNKTDLSVLQDGRNKLA
jgi:hypothetical protein